MANADTQHQDLATQLARIRSGQMYNDLTPALLAARQRAVLVTNQYNASFGQPQAARLAILRTLLGKVGDGAHLEPTFRCEFGSNIEIGHHFYANYDCVMLDGGGITIGDHVLLAPRVGIYTSNHAIDPHERAAGACWAKPVHIGDRVWVGAGVHINPGVRIGEGSVIGSGSVVTHDIPAYVIAAGVPCKVIRAITDADKTGYTAC